MYLRKNGILYLGGERTTVRCLDLSG